MTATITIEPLNYNIALELNCAWRELVLVPQLCPTLSLLLAKRERLDSYRKLHIELKPGGGGAGGPDNDHVHLAFARLSLYSSGLGLSTTLPFNTCVNAISQILHFRKIKLDKEKLIL